MKMMSKIENFIWCFMFTLGVELPINFLTRMIDYVRCIKYY